MKNLKTILLVASILIVSLVLTSVALANTRELTVEEQLQPLYEEKASLEAWRYWEGQQLEERKDLVNITKKVIEEINKNITENQDKIEDIIGSPSEQVIPSGGGSALVAYVEPEEHPDKYYMLADACIKHAQDPLSCLKIMEGVFVADSGFCTAGAGKTNNNCGNARPGSGKYGDSGINWIASNNWRKYETIQDGIYDNVAIYAQLYEGHTIYYMSNVWAGGSQNWLNTVTQYSNK